MNPNPTKQYKPYLAYQPSGVEWLGEIPLAWQVKKVKYTVQLINHKVNAFECELPYVGLEHIEPWTGRLIENENTSSEGTASKFKPEDVLFGKLRPYLAKVYLSTIEGVCSTEVLVLRSRNELNPKYLRYYLASRDFIYIVNGSTFGSKMPRASWEFIGELPQLIPIPKEQQTIVEFLDTETAKLDRLVEKKQRLIELLKEKRQATISQAVTKGLDPTVPMKDSGIEWLGEVPLHWTVLKVKRTASIFVPQRNKPELNENNNGIPWVTMDELTKIEIDGSSQELYVSSINAEISGSKSLPAGSVIASCVGNFGIASVSTTEVIINQQLQAYIPKPKIIDSWFLRYFIEAAKPYFEKIATTTTVIYVNQERFGELPVALPSLEEQKAITKFLDAETARLDQLVEKIELQIEKIKEYRQALISAAVTGKIDVRNIKPQDYQSQQIEPMREAQPV